MNKITEIESECKDFAWILTSAEKAFVDPQLAVVEYTPPKDEVE